MKKLYLFPLLILISSCTSETKFLITQTEYKKIHSRPFQDNPHLQAPNPYKKG